MSLRKPIMKTIYKCMEKDKSIFIVGEGAKVKAQLDYPLLLTSFPNKVITTPICEGGIINMALGASVMGMRPIADLTFNDLLLRAMDEILNHVSKIHIMSGGKLTSNLVIKVEFTKYENAQAGNRYDYLFKQLPPPVSTGLKVLIPKNEEEARNMMYEALHSYGPTLFFEDRLL